MQVRRIPAPRSLAALEELVTAAEPVVFPQETLQDELIEAGRQDPAKLLELLRDRAGDRKLSVAEIPPEAKGLLTHTGRGGLAAAWTPVEAELGDVIGRMLAEPPTATRVLIHGAPVGEVLPELEALMRLPIRPEVAGRLWLGTARGIDLSFDPFESLRWLFLGSLRVYLYPPSFAPEMKIGALDGSHLNAPLSLVDPEDGDADGPSGRLELELVPGEILFVPSYWWHSFRTEQPLGMMVHSWTDLEGRAAKGAQATFWQAVLALRELPRAHRDHYARLIDAVVFQRAGDPYLHLNDEEQGLAGAPTADRRRELRRRALREAARLAREALEDGKGT